MAGYQDYTKSNSAIKAEEQGLLPASRLGRQLGVSGAAVAAILSPEEWHHTSAKYNRTQYYRLATSDSEAADQLAQMRRFDRAKATAGTTYRSGVTVTWSEWFGQGRQKQREETTINDCLTAEKGAMTTIFFIDQQGEVAQMKKKTAGNWITFVGGCEIEKATHDTELRKMKRRATAAKRRKAKKLAN